jgi:hypothetical protein
MHHSETDGLKGRKVVPYDDLAILAVWALAASLLATRLLSTLRGWPALRLGIRTQARRCQQQAVGTTASATSTTIRLRTATA